MSPPTTTERYLPGRQNDAVAHATLIWNEGCLAVDISQLEMIVSRFVLDFDEVAYNLQETARHYDRQGKRIVAALNRVDADAHYAAISISRAERKGGAIAVSYLVRIGRTSFPVEVTHSRTSKMREAFAQLPINREVTDFFATLDA